MGYKIAPLLRLSHRKLIDANPEGLEPCEALDGRPQKRCPWPPSQVVPMSSVFECFHSRYPLGWRRCCASWTLKSFINTNTLVHGCSQYPHSNLEAIYESTMMLRRASESRDIEIWPRDQLNSKLNLVMSILSHYAPVLRGKHTVLYVSVSVYWQASFVWWLMHSWEVRNCPMLHSLVSLDSRAMQFVGN